MQGSAESNRVPQRIVLVSVSFPTPTPEGVLPRGGLEACAYYVARELATRHEVWMLASRLEGQAVEELVDGIRVLRCGPPRRYTEYGDLWGRYLFGRSAIRSGRALSPDVVLGYGLSCYWIAHQIARATRARSVAYVADVYLDFWREIAAPLPALVGRVAEKRLLSLAWDAYIAISKTTAERLTRLGAAPEAIAVVPPPIACETIRDLPGGPGNSSPVVSCVARHVGYKGIDVLLRALAEPAAKALQLRCNLVGTGALTPTLQTLAHDLGVADRVAFLGSGDRHEFAWETIKRSDVLCLPSRYEGFGMPVAEAFAAGVPVVCSDIPALRELTCDGEAGLLFSPGDHVALAERLALVLRDGALRERLARRGEAVVKACDCRTVSDATERVLLGD